MTSMVTFEALSLSNWMLLDKASHPALLKDLSIQALGDGLTQGIENARTDILDTRTIHLSCGLNALAQDHPHSFHPMKTARSVRVILEPMSGAQHRSTDTGVTPRTKQDVRCQMNVRTRVELLPVPDLVNEALAIGGRY